ncbi:calmodulin [Tritrichomonas foetus]|uniref:Calmodulin n=1 Tax=Tritrichomonas foetus TaxID=1144522 RepID=A0A1J4JX34_9EUKA|nr:calmodulin [Tritrichomonas foetus]|eukprot:OHT01837.1 calmodulin [Tritrichomonas foetus]
MRSIGQNPSDNELQEMIKQADADGSGTIQFEQFLKLMSAQKSEGESLEEIIEAFRVFDTDGDGKFSTADMTRILKNLGEPLTQEEIDEIIAQADPQKEGLIDYAAFAKLMLTS